MRNRQARNPRPTCVRSIVSVLLVAVVACGAQAAPTTTTVPTRMVELITAQPGGAQMEALGVFTLKYDPELNCLYFDEPDNNGEPGTGGRNIIVWPAGFTAEATGDEVVVHDPQGAAVASTGVPFQMSGGGGPYSGEHCDAIGAWIAASGPQPVDG